MTVKLRHLRAISRCRRQWRFHRNQLLRQFRMLLQVVFEVGDGIAGTGNFIAGRVHIDDEASRGNPHQYQHYQADPFLPVVSAVRKRHARSGNNQRNTRPEWRLTFAFFLFAIFRNAVNTVTLFRPAPETAQQENQTTRNDQADDRGNNQRGENFGHFTQV